MRNARLWQLWFTVGILLTLFTAFASCLTLVVLPIKYILELNQLSSSRLIDPTGIDQKSLVQSSTNPSEDRDRLLIQPIVRSLSIQFNQRNKFSAHFRFLESTCPGNICRIFSSRCCSALLFTNSDMPSPLPRKFSSEKLFPQEFYRIEFVSFSRFSREQIRVNGCGYFIFLLYPGAYVDLHQEQLQMISALRQMRFFNEIRINRSFPNQNFCSLEFIAQVFFTT